MAAKKVEIFYPSFNKNIPQSFIIKTALGQGITTSDFQNYYVKVYELDIPLNVNIDDISSLINYFDRLFELFNSEKNPLSIDPEIQNKIKENKSHTSMSPGDVIKINDSYYYVAGFGFQKILN